MAAKYNLQRIQYVARPGEGVEIEITSRSQPEGPQGTVTFGLDFTRAAVPDRRYVADAAGLVVTDDRARLLFAQSRVSGSELRSLLDIQMSTDNLQLVVTTFGPFRETRAKGNMPYSALTKISQEPDQTVGLAATTMAASSAGREACIDFYYMSPFVLGQLSQSGKIFADPVVRISLPTPLLNAMVEAMIDAAGADVHGGSNG